MNVYDGLHWNIYDILPYQRNFNLINSERSIGKTYTTEAYVIDKCIQNHVEFVYISRTKRLKEKGALEKGVSKVVMEMFPEYEFAYTIEEMYIVEDEQKRVIGRCIALSEENESKNMTFPLVKYFIFDEYVIEETSSSRYYNGWDEPDALLKIYHTVDREEDRVICFLLGNNIKFHNPYHMHKAFNIPFTPKGGIWTSENVLFQNAQSSKALKDKKSKSKFIRMIEATDYGTYAIDGEYMGDNYSFIKPLTENAHYSFTFSIDNYSFGVYTSLKEGLVYVSDKVDPSCKLVYALTLEDHRENTLLTTSKQFTQLQWLAKNFKKGNVRFVSMEVKMRAEKGISFLL
jgi:hypothetical protein